MLLGKLGASLLRNISSGWGINKKGQVINRAREGAIATRQGRGVVRAGYGHCSLNASKNKKRSKKQ